MAELLDAHGDVISTAIAEVARPARSTQVVEALTAAARTAQKDVSRQPRLAVVSAADPVDRATGRLVHLPDSPFLLGELSPADVLAGLVDGPVMVDNDVNWAARAERDATNSQQLDNFAYLHLGEAWAAPSSTTAWYAEDTPASSAKSPTSSRSVPMTGPPPHRLVRRTTPSTSCIDGDRRARTAGSGRTR